MKKQYLKIGFIIILSCTLNYIAQKIESDFLDKYLSENIVFLLITLLAINIATIGVIMTRLKEIVEQYGGNFEATISEMEDSVREQIILTCLAVMTLLFKSSKILQESNTRFEFVLCIILTVIFIYAIDILWDTAKAIFKILYFDQKKK